MSDDIEQRKLAAIMFADMVGYSALSQRDSKLALELLKEHREILRQIFPRFHGIEIKTIGDAFLVEFTSALEAAQCSIVSPLLRTEPSSTLATCSCRAISGISTPLSLLRPAAAGLRRASK